MVALNKKFYSRRKDIENKGDNIFSRASKNIATLTPIIFGIILGPTVVVSSIMSQAAFLMIANILLSIGLTVAFLNRVYQGNAKFLEIILTISMMAGLFFLVLYLSPVISGWNLLGAVSFINLFASSVNSFFLLRPLVLPPLLAVIEYGLSKVGIKVDVDLDKQRNFEVEIDLDKGFKSDSSATDLLMKNYPSATTKNLNDNTWRENAIAPYNHSKEVLYKYATRYRSLPFGEINNYEKISKCIKLVDSIFIDGATDSSHNVFFKNKLIHKSQKIKFFRDDIEKINSLKCDDIKKRFISMSSKDLHEKTGLVSCLQENVQLQLNKIINLLNCYPLHIAIDLLEKTLSKNMNEEDINAIKDKIVTEDKKSLYIETELKCLGVAPK